MIPTKEMCLNLQPMMVTPRLQNTGNVWGVAFLSPTGHYLRATAVSAHRLHYVTRKGFAIYITEDLTMRASHRNYKMVHSPLTSTVTLATRWSRSLT